MLVGSQTMAGPASWAPGVSSLRRATGAECQAPDVESGTASGGCSGSFAAAPVSASRRLRLCAPADGLHGQALQRQPAIGHEETVAATVHVEEGRGHRHVLAPRHVQGDIGACVLDVGAALDGDLPRREALDLEFGSCRRHQPLEDRRRSVRRRLVRVGDGLERQLHRVFAQGAHIGEPHAVGAEDAGQRVQDDRTHAEGVGDRDRHAVPAAPPKQQSV